MQIGWHVHRNIYPQKQQLKSELVQVSLVRKLTTRKLGLLGQNLVLRDHVGELTKTSRVLRRVFY